MKTLILGLGNTILTDDGAGIHVVRKVEDFLHGGSRITNHESRITIKEASAGGFNFIDLLADYDRAVIIDAIHTKKGRAGEFYELDPAALKATMRLSSQHGIDFATACEMARGMNIKFPAEIRIFVMEVEDEFTFGERCTPAVEEAIPKMAEFVFEELKESGWIYA